MTIDKFKHYLPASVYSHIIKLNKAELENQKRALIRDINLLREHMPGSEILGKRKIELNFINTLLN